MSKKQMNYDYMYKGKKNGSPMRTGYEKYTPGIVGKIALGITVPSALIALISVLIAAFGMIQAIVVTFFTFIIAFVGSVVIAIDIVRFNRQQKKATGQKGRPKGNGYYENSSFAYWCCRRCYYRLFNLGC